MLKTEKKQNDEEMRKHIYHMEDGQIMNILNKYRKENERLKAENSELQLTIKTMQSGAAIPAQAPVTYIACPPPKPMASTDDTGVGKTSVKRMKMPTQEEKMECVQRMCSAWDEHMRALMAVFSEKKTAIKCLQKYKFGALTGEYNKDVLLLNNKKAIIDETRKYMARKKMPMPSLPDERGEMNHASGNACDT